VVTVTCSLIAHNDDKASPRIPKVRIEARSEKDSSFEVWCLRAVKHIKHCKWRQIN